MKSKYEKQAEVRIVCGMVFCIIVMFIQMVGGAVPPVLTGICAFGIVPWILINAVIAEKQENKHVH